MPVLGFAKLSVVSLLRKFALAKRDRLLLYLFEWFLAGWAISSVFVFAFECGLPEPWNYLTGKCIDRVRPLAEYRRKSTLARNHASPCYSAPADNAMEEDYGYSFLHSQTHYFTGFHRENDLLGRRKHNPGPHIQSLSLYDRFTLGGDSGDSICLYSLWSAAL